jgi:hypothetical protein
MYIKKRLGKQYPTVVQIRDVKLLSRQTFIFAKNAWKKKR